MVARRSKPAEVVFVGSSVAGAAVDPEIVAAVCERQCTPYVAWLPAATGPTLELWTEDVVVPLLQPDTVVMALNSRDLNTNALGSEQQLAQYRSARGRREVRGRRTLLDRFADFAEDRSALIRNRDYLRRPWEIAKRLAGQDVPGDVLLNLPETGELTAFRDRDYSEDPDDLDKVRGYLNDYEVGVSDRAALIGTIVDLQRHGMTVVLVDLPVLESRWSLLHPHGEADLEQYRSILRTVARDTQAPLLEFRDGYQDRSLFSDWMHLNGKGASRFSHDLVRRLGPIVS